MLTCEKEAILKNLEILGYDEELQRVKHRDANGYIRYQAKSSIGKRLPSPFSTSLPKEVLTNNLTILCREKNMEFLHYEILTTGHTKVIRATYRCVKCNTENSMLVGNILKGHQCPDCFGTKRKTIEEVRKAFSERGYLLLTTEYKNAHIPLEYICNIHPDESRKINWNNFNEGKGCWECRNDKLRGSESPTWKGGITPLHNYLRASILPWIKDSMRNCGYQCVITGDRADGTFVVHHLKSFSSIIWEVLEDLNLPLYESVSSYSEKEKEMIAELNLKKHYELLGVCLRKDIHDMFHSVEFYGKKDNTPEQFYEFKERYNAGQFSE